MKRLTWICTFTLLWPLHTSVFSLKVMKGLGGASGQRDDVVLTPGSWPLGPHFGTSPAEFSRPWSRWRSVLRDPHTGWGAGDNWGDCSPPAPWSFWPSPGLQGHLWTRGQPQSSTQIEGDCGGCCHLLQRGGRMHTPLSSNKPLGPGSPSSFLGEVKMPWGWALHCGHLWRFWEWGTAG